MAVLTVGCTAPAETGQPVAGDTELENGTVSEMSIEAAQARVTSKVIDMAGVTGTALGLCDGKPCIKVYLESDDRALRSRMPRSEAGFPVVVEVSGRIQRW